MVTKKHRRFCEFAEACRRDRYIGLCLGPPGVGKTLSARQYAQWDEPEVLLLAWRANFTAGRDRADLHTLIYTPTFANSPQLIDRDLVRLSEHLAVIRAQEAIDPRGRAVPHGSSAYTELLIIDEADRLKTPGLEQPRSRRRAGNSLASAASSARSAQSGLGWATWRRSTATSCRNTKISTSLEAAPRASSTNQPNTLTTSRYRSRNSTRAEPRSPGQNLVTSSGTGQASVAVTRRHDLTDGQWAALEPLLPAPTGRGRPPKWSRRQLIDGIRWRIRTGAPWRDVPELYAPWSTVYGRFRRWQRDGTWAKILAALQAHADAAGKIGWTASVDSTISRAHQHAAGARRDGHLQKEPPGGVHSEPDGHALGRSRGGLSTKTHLVCEQGRKPLALLVTAGQRGDSPQFIPVLNKIRVSRLGGGRPRTRPDRGPGRQGLHQQGQPRPFTPAWDQGVHPE